MDRLQICLCTSWISLKQPLNFPDAYFSVKKKKLRGNFMSSRKHSTVETEHSTSKVAEWILSGRCVEMQKPTREDVVSASMATPITDPITAAAPWSLFAHWDAKIHSRYGYCCSRGRVLPRPVFRFSVVVSLQFFFRTKSTTDAAAASQAWNDPAPSWGDD